MTRTIAALQEALEQDLTMCHVSHEKIMVQAIGGREIRQLAEKIAQARQLTPVEIRIAQKHGFKG